MKRPSLSRQTEGGEEAQKAHGRSARSLVIELPARLESGVQNRRVT